MYIAIRICGKERMSDIALRYGISVEDIIELNGDDELFEGKRILIPIKQNKRYRVRPKDTLESIAQSHNVDLVRLKEKNNNIAHLFIGQIINIPC